MRLAQETLQLDHYITEAVMRDDYVLARPFINMMNDGPCLTFMAIYLLSLHVAQSNSKTSTVWRLTLQDDRIVGSKTEHDPVDPIFSIITSTVSVGQSWTKRYCSTGGGACDSTNATGLSQNKSNPEGQAQDEDSLDCGKSVNFTFYDNLQGVSARHTHPNIPEPQKELVIKKKGADISAWKKKLQKAKKEKPKSIQLYNQIGNFWRVEGNTLKSIECFRRALAVSPHNAEVLLNLARVLLNVHYLDDAIYLTRRSLEVQPPDRNAWQQYYTLGEIFKAYGHYQDAILHLRHALELKPDLAPALALLRDVESLPESPVHVYTIIIIFLLVIGVLLVILSSLEGGSKDGKNNDGVVESTKSSRHANRSTALRSLRLGISNRTGRARR